MTSYRRITPDGNNMSWLTALERRIDNLETRPAGAIHIRESITTTDPETGLTSQFGRLPDGTFGLQEYINDTTPPGPPSTPKAAPSMGAVTITWDGLVSGGAPQPKDYARTSIEYSSDNVNWRLGGTIYDQTSFVVSQLTAGLPYTFRLVSYDRNGNESAPSSTVTATPLAATDNADVENAIASLRDADAEIARKAQNAQDTAGTAATQAASAESKALEAIGAVGAQGRIIYTTTEPTSASDKSLNNLWVNTTTNTPHRYNGSKWIAITDKAALDAVAAAQAAQSRADEAFTRADTAAQSAGVAQSSADNKSRVWYLDAAPAGTGHRIGDVWFDTSKGNSPMAWNGAAWVSVRDRAVTDAQTSANTALATADGKNTIYYVATQPASTTAVPLKKGDMWFDTDDSHKQYTYSGNGWVKTQDSAAAQTTANSALSAATTAKQTADGKARVWSSATAPTASSGVTANDLWFDPANGNKPMRWDGSAWISVQDTAIAAAKGVADRALTSADGKSKSYFLPSQPTGGTYATGDTWFDTSNSYALYTYSDKGAWVKTHDSEAIKADAIAASLAASPRGLNYVTNGTFEQGLSGWDVNPTTASGLDTTVGHTGTGSWYSTGGGEMRQQGIPVEVGQVWEYSWYYKTDATWAGNLAGGLRLQSRTVDGTWTDTTAKTACSKHLEWTKDSVKYVVPEGVVQIRARFAFSYAGGARVWVDNIELTNITAATQAAESTARALADALAAADVAKKAARDAAGLANSMGRTWFQADPPPAGKVYSWDGTVQNSISLLTQNGVVERRNYYRNPAAMTGNFLSGWAGTSNTYENSWNPQPYAVGRARRMTWTVVANKDSGDVSASIQNVIGTGALKYGEVFTVGFKVRTNNPDLEIGAPHFYPQNTTTTTVASSFTGNLKIGADRTHTIWATGTLTPEAPTDARVRMTVRGLTVGTYIDQFEIFAYPGAYNPDYEWFTGDTPDEREYDLWIDTDEKNTPKRWNGAGWVSVTDQAAIDAAVNAAASDATAKANKALADAQADATTKANAAEKAAVVAAAAASKSAIELAEARVAAAAASDARDKATAAQDAAIAAAKTYSDAQALGASGAVLEAAKKDATDKANAAQKAAIEAAAAETKSKVEAAEARAAEDARIKADAALTAAKADTVTKVATKTKTWIRTTQPALTGNVTGDTWIDNSTAGGNKLYVWDGSAWVSVQDAAIAAAKSSADAAVTAANGKNKIVFSASDASGTSYAAGDLWMKRDSSGMIIAQWEFTTSWQKRTIGEAVLGNLSAGKITTGTLAADRIGANSIRASHILLGDFEEFIPNPYFHPAGEPVSKGTILPSSDPEVPVGAPFPNVLKITARDNYPFSNMSNIPAQSGDQFYIEAWVASAPTTTRAFSHYMSVMNAPTGGGTASGNNSQPPTTTWVKKTWNYTVPSNFTYSYIKPFLQTARDAAHVDADVTWYVTGWSMRRKTTGSLIVDGAIQAGSAIIGTGAIGSAQIGDAQIITAKIADAAITNAKINDLHASKITAGIVAADRLDANDIRAKIISAPLINATDILASGSITATNGIIASLDAAKITTGYISADRIEAGSLRIGSVSGLQTTVDAAAAANNTVNTWKGTDGKVNAANVTGTLAATVPGAKVSGAVPVASVPTLPTSKITNLDTALTSASATTSKVDGWTYTGTTQINGGSIQTDTVTAVQIKAQTLTSASGVFGDVNASVLTSGTIAADRIDANTIRTKLLAAGKINADDILVAGSITATSGVIGSLDASKITVGDLSAARIGAKTLSVDKLLLTSTDNMVQDADFAASTTTPWEYNTNVTRQAGQGRNSSVAARVTGTTAATAVNNNLTVVLEGGSTYRTSIWVKSSVATQHSRYTLKAKCYTSETAFTTVSATLPNPAPAAIAANVWTNVLGTLVIPASVLKVSFFVEVTNTTTAQTSFIDFVGVTRAADANLVVDGAIDGKTITGALIQSVAAANRGAKLSDTQFVFYNNNGVETMRLDGSNSIVTGAVVRTAAVGARVQMDATGLTAWDNANNEILKIADGGVNMTGNSITRGVTVMTGTAPQRPPQPISVVLGANVPLNLTGGVVPGLKFELDSKPLQRPPAVYSASGFGLTLDGGATIDNKLAQVTLYEGYTSIVGTSSIGVTSSDGPVSLVGKDIQIQTLMGSAGNVQIQSPEGNVTLGPRVVHSGGAEIGARYVETNPSTTNIPHNKQWGPGVMSAKTSTFVGDPGFVGLGQDVFQIYETGVYDIWFFINTGAVYSGNSRMWLVNDNGGATYAVGKKEAGSWEFNLRYGPVRILQGTLLRLYAMQDSGAAQNWTTTGRFLKLA